MDAENVLFAKYFGLAFLGGPQFLVRVGGSPAWLVGKHHYHLASCLHFTDELQHRR